MAGRLAAAITPEPRLGLLVAAAFALVLLAELSKTTNADPDMWHQMALIREALRPGAMTDVDPFAYTPTRVPVVHHEWGFGVLLYAVAKTTGASGVLAVRYGLTAAIFVGVVVGARRRGANPAVLAALAMPALLLAATVEFTTVRARLVTAAFLVVELLLLERDRAGDRRWIVPWLLLYLVWLNLHGGFVLGAAVLALHALEQLVRGRTVRHLAWVGAAMVALVAVNPWGLEYYRYLWRALTLDRVHITEWRPVWHVWPPTVVMFALSIALFVYAGVARGFRRLTAWPMILAAAFAATRHLRHLSPYAIIWFFFVPAYLQATPLGARLDRFWNTRRSWIAVAATLVVLPMAVIFLEGRPWHLPLKTGPGGYPAGAVDYLANVGFEGNLFVPFTCGAFVTWRLHPAVRVSIDGRYEVAYRDGVLEDHLVFYQVRPGWSEVLGKYPTDAVLVHTSAPVARRLPEVAGWKRVYRDDGYELYARTGLDLPPIDRTGERIDARFPRP